MSVSISRVEQILQSEGWRMGNEHVCGECKKLKP